MLRARISIALGIRTKAEFMELPLTDQEFWLAYQMRKDRELKRLLEKLSKPEYPDVGSMVQVLMEMS